MKQDLQALKTALTIPDVWRRLGLAGTPGKTCRSPFREDRKPSFSIHDDGRRWKDFATGEGGDAIDFIAHACAVDTPEATRRFLTMAGTSLPLPCSPPRPTPARSLILPPLHRGTLAEVASVARSRRLNPAAIALAQSLPTLAFGDVCGLPSWILCDDARRIAEARRVDGRPFPPSGELAERKAHTLRGSVKNWPVGVAVLHRHKLPHFRAIMLVEGGPDYLAALHFALARDVHDVLPVAMLGRCAGHRLDSEALALLQDRTVRIYPHNDPDGGGMVSACAWAQQLHEHGCAVDLYPLTGLSRCDGVAVKDLNDCAVIAPADESQLSDLLP